MGGKKKRSPKTNKKSHDLHRCTTNKKLQKDINKMEFERHWGVPYLGRHAILFSEAPSSLKELYISLTEKQTFCFKKKKWRPLIHGLGM